MSRGTVTFLGQGLQLLGRYSERLARAPISMAVWPKEQMSQSKAPYGTSQD